MPVRKCPSCGAKIPKTTRVPNAYNLFIKEAFQREEIKALPPKSRMKAAADLWKAKK